MFMSLLILSFSLGVFPMLGMAVGSSFGFWALMELNLFLFLVGLGSKGKLSQMYFCMSSFGGVLFLSGYLLQLWGLVLLGLLVKLGAFPFPFWVPYLVGMEWQNKVSQIFLSGSILLVLSKMLPLIGLFKFSDVGLLLMGVMVIKLVVGGGGMFYATKMGELLGWSGVATLSLWGIFMKGDLLVLVTCFYLYSATLIGALFFLSRMKMAMLLLVLVGVPPFLVFFFKVYLFYILAHTGSIIVTWFMLGFVMQSFSYLYWLSYLVMLKKFWVITL